MDVCFLDELAFSVPPKAWHSSAGTWSVEERLRACLDAVGLELIDYGSVLFVPGMTSTKVSVMSRAWGSRAQRATS